MNRIEKLTAHLKDIYLTDPAKSLMLFDHVEGDVKIRIAIDFLHEQMFILDAETHFDTIESCKYDLNLIYSKELY